MTEIGQKLQFTDHADSINGQGDQMQDQMKSLVLAIAAQTLSSAALCSTDPALVSGSDQQVNVAIIRAQRSLDDFLRVKANPSSGETAFTVKVVFTRGASVEHMWVIPFRPDGKGGLQGILKSEPRVIPDLRFGQEVNFTRQQITDWGYTREGELVGYFTTCVLLARDDGLRKRLKALGQTYKCDA